MIVITKGKVIDVYEKEAFINKETGEASPKRFAIQIIADVKLKNGQTKKELFDINIKEDLITEYKSNIGKDIQVNCKLYSNSPISLTAV